MVIVNIICKSYDNNLFNLPNQVNTNISITYVTYYNIHKKDMIHKSDINLMI